MSAQFAKDRVSYVEPTNFSAAAPAALAPVTGSSPVGAIAKWFAERLQRRAVVAELSMLSDHELADIGLSRGDIPRVFDRSFAARA
jgi:uncharacterized protein YjiS (DUF1127 family)